MTEINQKLLDRNVVLKEIKNITPKTRKKIQVFLGVDIKQFYYLLVKIDTKSRFIQKNALELMEFVKPLSEINFQKNKKILFLNSPICSKASVLLQANGWRII